MALQLGGILGAASNLTTAMSKPLSLKSFLNTVDKFGIQTSNNFEVNFSGLSQITFYVQSITIPSSKMITSTLYYNGRSVTVPVVYDFDHDFSLTCLNDASGILYSTILAFISSGASNALANSGYTMTIKAIAKNTYKGTLITMRGVRLIGLDGLSFGHSSNDVQTFNLNCQCVDYTVTPGAAAKVAGIAGTLKSLLG